MLLLFTHKVIPAPCSQGILPRGACVVYDDLPILGCKITKKFGKQKQNQRIFARISLVGGVQGFSPKPEREYFGL